MPNLFLPFLSPLQRDLARTLPLHSPKHKSCLLKLALLLPPAILSCPWPLHHVFPTSKITHFSVSTLGVAFKELSPLESPFPDLTSQRVLLFPVPTSSSAGDCQLEGSVVSPQPAGRVGQGLHLEDVWRGLWSRWLSRPAEDAVFRNCDLCILLPHPGRGIQKAGVCLPLTGLP